MKNATMHESHTLDECIDFSAADKLMLRTLLFSCRRNQNNRDQLTSELKRAGLLMPSENDFIANMSWHLQMEDGRECSPDTTPYRVRLLILDAVD